MKEAHVASVGCDDIAEESIFIPLHDEDKLHLKRFYANPDGTPVFMLHGSIENGRIFYSQSKKGFAPFLARQGYDVFVADVRGRGQSTPPITRNSEYGISECIREEVPAFINEIQKIKGTRPQYWIGHSWGGILELCYLARNPNRIPVAGMIFFGTKRRITIRGLRKFLIIDVFYNLIFGLIAELKGYVDVKFLRVGSDNETDKSRRQTYRWITQNRWKDEDGFDYSRTLKQMTLPPSLFITGSHDRVLGHRNDVKLLMEEIGQANSEFFLASEKNGCLHNYNHINILTHPDAPEDHFQKVLKWMKQRCSRGS